MKKIFTTLLASVAILTLQAQAPQNMFLHFADGSQKIYHVQDIDSVTFEEAPDYSDLAFDIQISDINSNGARVIVKSNRPDVLWYSDAFEKGYLDVYTPAQLAQAQLEAMYQEWVQYEEEYKMQYGEDMTFADFFYAGNETDDYVYDYLDPATDYIILAFGVDLEMLEAVGTPAFKEFSTPEAEPSTNIISFSFANDTLYINTTNDDPYFWNAFLPEDVADYGVETATEAWEAVVAEMDEVGWLEYFLSEGSEANAVKSYFYGLPGTHTIVAAGWNGQRTTDYFIYELTLTEEQVTNESSHAPAKQLKAIKKQLVRQTKHTPLQMHPAKKVTLTK